MVGLPTKADIVAWLSVPEHQARLVIYAWYVSMGMMVLGYLIIAYLLFLNH